MAGVISGLSVSGSMLQHEKRELVVGVFTPGLCVRDVKVNVTPVNVSRYQLDADVAFNGDSAGSCVCKTGGQHFVRVFFTAPATGKIVITAAPGIAPGPIDTVVVY
jgi:hypothetical protein